MQKKEVNPHLRGVKMVRNVVYRFSFLGCLIESIVNNRRGINAYIHEVKQSKYKDVLNHLDALSDYDDNKHDLIFDSNLKLIGISNSLLEYK